MRVMRASGSSILDYIITHIQYAPSEQTKFLYALSIIGRRARAHTLRSVSVLGNRFSIIARNITL